MVIFLFFTDSLFHFISLDLKKIFHFFFSDLILDDEIKLWKEEFKIQKDLEFIF